MAEGAFTRHLICFPVPIKDQFFSAELGDATDKDVIYPLSKEAGMVRAYILSEELEIRHYLEFSGCKFFERLGSIIELGERKWKLTSCSGHSHIA